MHIVVTAKNFCPEAKELLESRGHSVKVVAKSDLATQENIINQLKDADAVIAGTETLLPETVRTLKNVKLYSRNGIGYDGYPLDVLKEMGIGLTRTVGAVEGAVAEHVMAYILYFARRVDEQSAVMHKHIWKPGLSLGAKTRTLGLVGFGGIGKEIAKRAKPFGMNILYYCRHPNPEDEQKYGVSYRDLDDLLAKSDFVSVNVPLTPETRGMFSKELLEKMKPGSYFINISRGPVVVEKDLAEVLQSGHLTGAGIDVFEKEPTTTSPLMDCPTAVLTPHTASSTIENSRLMNLAAAENLLKYFDGTIDRKFVVVEGKR